MKWTTIAPCDTRHGTAEGVTRREMGEVVQCDIRYEMVLALAAERKDESEQKT